jgi:hypothetical protein
MIFIEYDMSNLWRYRLIVYNTNVSSSMMETDPALDFKLHQNFPNPFNPSTTIRFNLFQPERIKLEIFNINGEVICNLIDKEFSPGQHELIWDGLDSNGSKVSSGVYFYRLISSDKELTKKMILIK